MVRLDRPHGHYESRCHGALLSSPTLTPVSTADAGTLVITADGTAMSMAIGIAVVLWDERGNPISVNSGMITLSGWCKNAAGNYIAANGYGVPPQGSSRSMSPSRPGTPCSSSRSFPAAA